MNMYDVICKKRDGLRLDGEEIRYFIEGYTKGDIPDYQAAALLMAIFLRGMDQQETFELTDAMMHSGEVADLGAIPGIKVDKHSTGGVGDKTTLVVAPLAAACGVPVAKMSGRGLGFTGGTVDKMEAIPGFCTVLEPTAFLEQVKKIGIAVIGQSAHIASADKKLYALRDVTATVDHISLITASIMSKKLASGSDAIVLDVKCGRGAFMERMEDAVALSNLMVQLGTKAGKKTIAVITDMSQPLGFSVGNSLEVMEAIETLKGKGPEDMTQLSLYLAGLMIFVGEKAQSEEEGYRMAKTALENGAALEKFRQFIEAQGGDSRVIADGSLFPQAAHCRVVYAQESGFVCNMEARRIGMAAQHTGAGREKKEDAIDPAAGLVLHKKVGDPLKIGDALVTLYGNNVEKLEKAAEEAAGAFVISAQKPEKIQLIKKIIMS